MTLTYRTRRRLQRIGLVALILLLAAIVIWLCWVIWAERYVVYTREGATIDFDVSEPVEQGQIAAPPSTDETISIFYNEGADAISENTELTQITGYYIDADTLQNDLTGAMNTVATLSSGTAVMVELKSPKGYFYYSSSLSDAAQSSAVNAAAVNNLITEITSRNLYAIAVIPAFRDYNYGLNHVSCGLALPQGYLWADDDYCYWLDPSDSTTINWLKQIIEELRDLGFDEVVFTEFRFPGTDSIVFDGDKNETINKAASNLVSACATNGLAISFMTTDSAFTLPEGRSRLYIQNVSAKNVASVAATTTVADPTANLVFMATTNDTRFNEYSVIRPITAINPE